MKKLFTAFLFGISFLSTAYSQWEPQGKGVLPLAYGVDDLSAVDENVVWVLAHDDSFYPDSFPQVILRSINGGIDWDVYPVNNLYVQSLTGVNDSIAWISALDSYTSGIGYFLQTTTGGASWDQKYSYTGSINSQGDTLTSPVLKFINEKQGYFVDIQARRAGSTQDGGLTWTVNDSFYVQNEVFWFPSPQNWLEAKEDKLWFGTSKTLKKSEDGGMSWQSTSIPGDNLILSVNFDDSGYGIASTDVSYQNNAVNFLDHTVLWKSEDYGESWEPLSDLDYPVTSVTQVPGEEKTFFGVSGVYSWWFGESNSWASAYTTDGGESWTRIDQDIPYHTIDFVSISNGWAGTIGGYDYGYGADQKPIVFKWNMTSKTQKIEDISASISLWPNPFSDHLNLSCTNEIPERITLYNSSGTSLTTFRGPELSECDLSHLPSGLYTLEIQLKARVVSKKVIKR